MRHLTGASTDLERAVVKWAEDHDDDAVGSLRELLQHGCESGMVGFLVRYVDTVAFYELHKWEINDLLAEVMARTGARHPASTFGLGERWDYDDPLALGQLNQNALAWFGFQEAARKIAEMNGIDV